MEDIKILKSEDFEEIKLFYSKLERESIYNSPEYLLFWNKYFKGELEVFVFQDDMGMVYYPYFVRELSEIQELNGFKEIDKYKDIISSWYYGGPLFNNDNGEFLNRFRKRFVEYCRDTGIVSEFVRFDPYFGNGNYNYEGMKVEENRDVVYIDLKLSDSDIISNYKKKYRLIKRAEKNNVKIEFNNEIYLNEFHKIYDFEMKRKNAPESYFFNVYFFKDFINLKNTFFVSVIKDEKFIGGGLTIGNGFVMHDYLRATDISYWDLRINDFLIHENIFKFKEIGYKIYDLQGGRKGVYEFKKSFSPFTKKYHLGSSIFLQDVYDKLSIYNKYSSDDYFPSYRKKDKN